MFCLQRLSMFLVSLKSKKYLFRVFFSPETSQDMICLLGVPSSVGYL